MKTPQLWKNLKRHSLSAEYRDITGPAWYAFTLRMRAVGFLAGFPIILHDDEVLDGWQRLRACIELGIVPTFAKLPGGIDIAEYVEAVNDHRRHETSDERQERIDRIAAAKAAGKSNRMIANEEGISESQTRRDLEQAASGAPGGGAPEPLKTDEKTSATSPKVTGYDGKQYPATTKKRCPACTHRAELGRPLIEKCPDCWALNAKPKPPEPAEEVEPEAEDIVVDDDEVAVPAALRSVFSQTYLFRSAAAMCAKAAIALDKVEKSIAYALTDKQASKSQGDRRVYSTVCRTAEKKMIGLRPAKVCCGQKNCKACGGKGFLTHDEVTK